MWIGQSHPDYSKLPQFTGPPVGTIEQLKKSGGFEHVDLRGVVTAIDDIKTDWTAKGLYKAELWVKDLGGSEFLVEL